jgi:hypothetical protein
MPACLADVRRSSPPTPNAGCRRDESRPRDIRGAGHARGPFWVAAIRTWPSDAGTIE